MARVVTEAGQSVGQQGRASIVPITTSAACGSPVQQDWFTETIVVRPTWSRTRKPTSDSLRTWCEHVDWLIPSRTAMSPTVRAPEAEEATACSNLSRVGSEMLPNHSAYSAATSGLSRLAAVSVSFVVTAVTGSSYRSRSMVASIDTGRYDHPQRIDSHRYKEPSCTTPS